MKASENASTVQLQPADSTEGSAQTRARILIVEDNDLNKHVMALLIEKLGLRYDLASNGEQALGMLRKNAYSLILMDCEMPLLDGFSATTAIRALDEPLSTIPVIAVTANVLLGQREKCFAAGMNDFLSKPITRAGLRATLEKWLPSGALSPG